MAANDDEKGQVEVSKDSYDKETIRRLISDQLEWSEIKRIMSRYKDSDRFDSYRELLQERVEWDEFILLPLSEKLYLVAKESGGRVVKCECGHEFCEGTENWRLHALLYVRNDTESLAEIYPGAATPKPEYVELREFYCPGCATQLEVDTMTPGYPILHEFEPDVDAFYREWLGKEAPGGAA